MSNSKKAADMEARREKILARITRLPPLSDNVMRILRLLDDVETTAQAVGAEIARDQALAAQVLRLVNSGFYGLSQSVASLSHATVLLGFNIMRDLVLSSSVASVLVSAFPGLYDHSLACSRACGHLSRSLGVGDPGEACTVGLLHDVGKTVLSQCFMREFQVVGEFSTKCGITFGEAEAALLGLTHATMGKWLLEKWNLPERTVAPIAEHHSFDEESPHASLVALLQLGDVLVRAEGFGHPGDNAMPRLPSGVIRHLSLKTADVAPLMDEIVDQMGEIPRYLEM